MGILDLFRRTDAETTRKEHGPFSRQAVDFGKTILEEPFIKDASRAITAFYAGYIIEYRSEGRGRVCRYNLFYAVTDQQIFGKKYEHDDYYREPQIFYKDYGIALVEDETKRLGIAWALQSIIVPNLLERFPAMSGCKVSVENNPYPYSGVGVTISFEIQTGLREL